MRRESGLDSTGDDKQRSSVSFGIVKQLLRFIIRQLVEIAG